LVPLPLFDSVFFEMCPYFIEGISLLNKKVKMWAKEKSCEHIDS